MVADNSERYGDEWVDLGEDEDSSHLPASETSAAGEHSHLHKEGSFDKLDEVHVHTHAGQPEQQTAAHPGKKVLCP